MPALFYFCGKEAALGLLAGSLFIFFLYNMLREKELADAAYDTAFRILGIVYIALPLSFLIPLRGLVNGEWWIMFLFIVIWSNDTFAYFAGRSLGKHKLCPRISPKKTVEGAVAGISGGAILALIFNHYAGLGAGAAQVLVITILIGIIGIIGDLAESLLKRSAGIKDSGTLIPGHGGVLDRIDSLLFPIPVLYYFLICQSQAFAG